MSRIRVFGTDGYAVGELQAVCSRGWAVNSGGSSTISLGEDALRQAPWLNFGKIALIEHESLPLWAGVIEVDWKALLPVQVTLYDIPYLLKMRSIESGSTVTGTTAQILMHLIDQANRPMDTGVRPGEMTSEFAMINQVIEQRLIWDQMVEIANRGGVEMTFQPEIDTTNRLTIRMDVRLPVLTDPIYTLHDGEGGNMTVTDAVVGGTIVNRLLATSDESTVTSRRKSGPIEDPVSIGLYGMRSAVSVIAGTVSQSDLDNAARVQLANGAAPKVKLTVSILDRESTFKYLRIGNILNVRGSRVHLPGGKVGWEGIARITAMAYDESKNAVNLSLEGNL